MQFPGNLNLKPMNILKIAGLVIVAVIVVIFAVRLIGSSVNSLVSKTSVNKLAIQSAPAMDSPDAVYSEYSKDADTASYSQTGGTAALSTRNVESSKSPILSDGTTTGDDAEEFEVTEYSANIEARNLKNTCDEIAKLKSRDDVIFERANEYERSCNYVFKVKLNGVPEILAIIEKLDPKELDESAYTIKRLVDDYTGEVEILQKKMSAIETTLAGAVKAYDDITVLATKTKDVESLAKIIDSKINIIERLTQERINVSTQLERLERAKSEQLDRLDYTFFNVNIVEDKFIDWKILKDSWKAEIKSFVRDVNAVLQDISVNLVKVLFVLLQFILYFFVILIIIKYVWRLVKYIWKK